MNTPTCNWQWTYEWTVRVAENYWFFGWFIVLFDRFADDFRTLYRPYSARFRLHLGRHMASDHPRSQLHVLFWVLTDRPVVDVPNCFLQSIKISAIILKIWYQFLLALWLFKLTPYCSCGVYWGPDSNLSPVGAFIVTTLPLTPWHFRQIVLQLHQFIRFKHDFVYAMVKWLMDIKIILDVVRASWRLGPWAISHPICAHA
jgi:hypothetical protein